MFVIGLKPSVRTGTRPSRAGSPAGPRTPGPLADPVQAAFCWDVRAARFAINAARRVPRDQGRFTPSLLEASITDLMKRALVFMLCILLSMGNALSSRITMQMLSGTDWAFHEKIQIIRADLGAVCGTRSKARNTLEFMTCGRKCAAIQTGCWPAMGRNLGRCLSHCCLNSRCYSTIAAISRP